MQLKETTNRVREFLQLAIPLVMAQLAQSMTGFIDSIMMGRLGAETLAAGGLASWSFIAILNTAAGVVTGNSPLVAEAYGAGKKSKIESFTRQGFWLVLLLSIPVTIVVANLDSLMLRWGQSEETVALASSYLDTIVWGFLPALGFAMVRGVLSGMSITRPIMIIVTVGTLFNICGNYILGFGKLGFPRLELTGLAIASTLSLWGMFIASIICLLRHPHLRQYSFFTRLYRLQPNVLRELSKTGIPIGIFMALELGLFTVVAYLMGTLGTQTLAAHQVVFQTIMVTFMIPLGMSFATTAIVGQWLGRENLREIKRAGSIAITIGFMVMSMVAVVMLLFPRIIIGLYLNLENPANAEIISLALPILRIAAVSQILDGVQKIVYGALLGIQDTQIPVILNVAAFWGVGLTLGYILGFSADLGGVGLWLGQSLGVATAAVFFLIRFWFLLTSSHLLLKMK